MAAHNVSDEAHRAQVAELEASLASWQQQHSVSNEAHAAEVSELRGQVAQLEAAVEERGRSLTAASAEAAQLRADVAQRSEAHAALEAKVRARVHLRRALASRYVRATAAAAGFSASLGAAVPDGGGGGNVQFARIVKAGKAQLAKLTQEKHRAEQRSTLLSKLCDDVSAKVRVGEGVGVGDVAPAQSGHRRGTLADADPGAACTTHRRSRNACATRSSKRSWARPATTSSACPRRPSRPPPPPPPSAGLAPTPTREGEPRLRCTCHGNTSVVVVACA